MFSPIPEYTRLQVYAIGHSKSDTNFQCIKLSHLQKTSNVSLTIRHTVALLESAEIGKFDKACMKVKISGEYTTVFLENYLYSSRDNNCGFDFFFMTL